MVSGVAGPFLCGKPSGERFVVQALKEVCDDENPVILESGMRALLTVSDSCDEDIVYIFLDIRKPQLRPMGAARHLSCVAVSQARCDCPPLGHKVPTRPSNALGEGPH